MKSYTYIFFTLAKGAGTPLNSQVREGLKEPSGEIREALGEGRIPGPWVRKDGLHGVNPRIVR